MATAELNIDLTTLNLEEVAINKFSELINTHKAQIITKFTQLHDTLHNKQTSLINELDNLLTDIRTHRQTHDDQLRQLRETKEQVQTNLTHNKLNTVLQDTVKQLQDSINKLENETLDIPTVDVSWDTSNYSTVVNNICRIEIGKLSSYSNRTQPIWSTVSKGTGQNQLYTPQGLAVDQVSGNIYVTDYMAKRIQIYSSVGEYVRAINTDNYSPFCIQLDIEYCYVMCSLAQLFKINKLSGDIVNRLEISIANIYREINIASIYIEINIASMCLEGNSIFMCVIECNIVLVYNTTDLKQNNSILLNTQYYTNETSPYDIKLLPAQLIILFTDTDYPLQCFTREGVFLRNIISKQQIKYAFYFCIDLYNNYIISDRDDNNIKIFTPSGQLITSIGKLGQEIGQFNEPHGICLDLNNRIIICDCKDNYILQAF